MGCYAPIPAYVEDGKPAVLRPPVGKENIALPCGECIGCKTDRATQWAVRAEHEASLWPVNTFVTLTYDDDHKPPDGLLRPRHLQLFLKRLRADADRNRQYYDGDRVRSFRYLACGEYGDRTGRPHYHAALFNLGFADGYAVSHELARSDRLSKLWGMGKAEFGPFTPAAANYIAQYTLKRQRGDSRLVDYQTGEIIQTPFLRCSLKPGIGNLWLERHKHSLKKGFITDGQGGKRRPPRAYKKYLEQHDPELLEEIKATEQRHRMDNPSDRNNADRRAASEAIHKARKRLYNTRTL